MIMTSFAASQILMWALTTAKIGLSVESIISLNKFINRNIAEENKRHKEAMQKIDEITKQIDEAVQNNDDRIAAFIKENKEREL